MNTPTNNTQPTKKDDENPYAIPVAIIVAGALIAGAVVFSTGGGGTSADPNTANSGDSMAGPSAVENMRPVTEDDHIRGSIDAPVKIVEYSDLECPFCKRFHPTVQQALDEFGDNQVAWVWRHFPLTSIHPKAVRAAVATECAAQQGGDDAFWAYVDRYFVVTPSNNQIDLAELPRIADHIGLNVDTFNACLTSGQFDQAIQDNFQDAVDSGGQGTPYTIVVGPGGEKRVVSGAQPYSQLRSIITQLLQ